MGADTSENSDGEKAKRKLPACDHLAFESKSKEPGDSVSDNDNMDSGAPGQERVLRAVGVHPALEGDASETAESDASDSEEYDPALAKERAAKERLYQREKRTAATLVLAKLSMTDPLGNKTSLQQDEVLDSNAGQKVARLTLKVLVGQSLRIIIAAADGRPHPIHDLFAITNTTSFFNRPQVQSRHRSSLYQ